MPDLTDTPARLAGRRTTSQPATPTTPRQHDQGETTPDTPAN